MNADGEDVAEELGRLTHWADEVVRLHRSGYEPEVTATLLGPIADRLSELGYGSP